MSFLSRNYKVLSFAFLCLFLAFQMGCEKAKPKEPVGSLTGTVSSDAEAISKCRVRIYNTRNYKSAMVTTAEDGTYEFQGVSLGQCKMAVLQEPWYEASRPPFDNRIPQKYRDVKTSGFELTIKEGENNLDLEMKK